MTTHTPEAIRDLRSANTKMRERDFARIHRISEAELVAAYVGQGNTRLVVDIAALLEGMPACGEVMALTRNESVVHEKIGPFEKGRASEHSAIVLGEQIDLRIFPSRWKHGFAVEKLSEEGEVRRSLQFFDGAGEAVFKIHARPATDLVAWQALVERLTAPEQSQVVVAMPYAEKDQAAGTPASAEELRTSWDQLTDTHQFFGMLKRLNLTRIQAMNMIGESHAWPVSSEATASLLQGAVAQPDLSIMVFVGNPGCIQIHSGPIKSATPMGPWLNVLDETFHMHLRLDHIAQAWVVRKPTDRGHVTSLECYDAEERLIVQFFGKRVEGHDERPAWRALTESLPRIPQSTAA
ncbi:hemin-degrading factor [Devosia sp. CN2-171]|uniref:hemin-degrading factor n=1 Tax=Devosia sp. CN2-171 TaxID=3400909 RepID=UPI003BF7B96A